MEDEIHVFVYIVPSINFHVMSYYMRQNKFLTVLQI